MNFRTQHVVPAPREEVWDWHTRPGALARLTPPFLPMSPLQQASNLADGTNILGLPAGLRWVARHDLSRYRRGYSFSDVCINAPLRTLATWRHTRTFADAPSGSPGQQATSITDTVTTRLPRAALRSIFAYRQHQLINDLAFLHRLQPLVEPVLADTPTTVAVTGSRGAVGRALCAQLTTAGVKVVQLVRNQPKPGQRHWNPLHPAPDLLEGIGKVVHLAGEPIFGRFNEAHKQALRSSRIGPTRALAELAARTPGVETFVSASAIGYYGPNRGSEVLTETSEPGEGFLAELVTDWEAATTAARDAGLRVATIRTGVALAGNAGLLPIVRTLFQTGLGGTFGSGEFWFSWIAQDDLTDIYMRALFDSSLSGPLNAVAPEPVLNRNMAHALARELNRPALLPIPTLGPALLLGKEGASELALADQRVTSTLLGDHTFRYPTIDAALAHELGGEALVEQLPD
ncbi:TIGR01777 family protein [Corynebacterium lizhenjunii]|uniref:TIGR01777 family protein n=1 Tax=Corynebacterium lizhenjunii TaxID=2709394 RepID=A0A7T0KD72_9CORY|nr:TIGR01777 family oxidoreductase [Corynebacterium lizhenjunii]QPK78206.1 TIGR01777 family protein [Corynebacterium lizhenjunii]